MTDDLKSTAYDALVGGEAVCEGYARATQLLLNKLGVENFLVIGDAKNDDGKIEPHMWNIVEQDGRYYIADITNSDTVIITILTLHGMIMTRPIRPI